MKDEMYINDLEEKAMDGDTAAARELYEYYLETKSDKAEFWKQYMDPVDAKQENTETEEENNTETPAQSWLKDYKTHSMRFLTVKELTDKCREGNPFAYLAFAEQYLSGDDKIEERLQYYNNAVHLLEKNLNEPGYKRVLAEVLMKLGNLYRSMSSENNDESARKAFNCYINVFELDEDEYKDEVTEILKDCYLNGFGCEKSEEKYNELRIRKAGQGGTEDLLKLAVEYQNEGKMIETINYLQQCVMRNDEESVQNWAYKMANFKLAVMGVPGADRTIPSVEETGDALLRVIDSTNYLTPDEIEKLSEFYLKDFNENDTAEEKKQKYEEINSRYQISVYRIASKLYEIKHYKSAAKLCELGADCGDSAAMNLLGMCYEFGQGVPQDYTKAMEWFQKAADLGENVALFNIGNLYENGNGVPQDYAKAMEWYQKAADLGNDYTMTRYAMLYVGNLYYNGQGVPQDYTKAMEWYQKAADLGEATAMNIIGTLYANGLGVPRDYSKAMEWFHKAADLGDIDAMRNIGSLYSYGQGVPQDYTKAMEWFHKAADLGDAAAMDIIGIQYAYGLGVPQDYAKAVEWYQKAADLGYADAMRSIGCLYADGLGVPRDDTKAMEWLHKAADLGNADAMNYIGYLYANGKGVPQDYAKAMEWYQKAADLGDSRAAGLKTELEHKIIAGSAKERRIQAKNKAIEWVSLSNLILKTAVCVISCLPCLFSLFVLLVTLLNGGFKAHPFSVLFSLIECVFWGIISYLVIKKLHGSLGYEWKSRSWKVKQ